ncbi:hypothetical protein [Bacillus paranthracis]|uniref:hypothetical protein n=1 Tax=Bacillus paranthracis TaxID=2026186 RepID=UPI0021FC23C2|nr:hypothetical protein [Bacillus paranthracis]UXR28934.1 hypothetical protein [Bacillus phage Nachito]
MSKFTTHELQELYEYFKAYGDEAPDWLKVSDITSLAEECLRLRKVLKDVTQVDTSRIQRDNRSIVAIQTMRNLALNALGQEEEQI